MDTNSENSTNQINEIAKLVEVLNIAKKINPNTSSTVAYGKLFGIEDCDEIMLTEAKYEILTIIKKAKENLINSRSNNTKKSVDLLNQTSNIFASINLSDSYGILNNFKDYCQKLYDSMIYIEEFYGQLFNEKLLPDAKIQELLSQIDDLINDLNKADIDNDFKNIIVQELLKLQQSMYKYKIYGNAGIENIICELTGKIILKINNPEVITEQEQNILEKVLSFIINTNNIISFSENISKIAANATPLLLTMFNNFVN
jgi:hypothetical protein